MANIGEALTTRLARERFEANKKFIPVRDSVREKLRARQEAKVEFTEGAEVLFKPVTTTTEAVKTAIIGKPDPTDPDPKPQPGLLQVLQQHGKTLEDISAGLRPPPSPPGEGAAAGPSVISKIIKQPKAIVSPSDRFRPEFAKLPKSVSADQLANTVITGWNNRDKILNPTYRSMKDVDFAKYAYRIYYNMPQASGAKFGEFLNKTSELSGQLLSPPPVYSAAERDPYQFPPPLQRQEREQQGEDGDQWEDVKEYKPSPQSITRNLFTQYGLKELDTIIDLPSFVLDSIDSRGDYLKNKCSIKNKYSWRIGRYCVFW